MQRCFKLRKDNRGDTLIIVIVAILMLSILGAVVLASSSMYYNLAGVDKSQKKTFYSAEQAVDEVYAGVGEDVMDAMKFAYTYVLNNMMTKNADGDYVTNDNKELNTAFRNICYYYLTGRDSAGDLVPNWDAIKNSAGGIASDCPKYYRPEVSMVGNMQTHLQSFASKAETTVTIPAAEAGVNKAITYSTKNVVTTSGDNVVVDYFTIKNVTATYKDHQGVTSKVGTDIVVEIPVVDINFSEVSVLDYGDLFKYIVVAEGDAASLTTPVLSVTTPVDVAGNIYAGKLASSKKEGIKFDTANAVIASKNIVTSGDINVHSSEVRILKNDLDDKAQLNIWAKNIATTGNHDVINIEDADVVVEDDLSIDGSGSTVKITGNYFGFGFHATDSSNMVEADSGENDKFAFSTDATGTVVRDASGNVVDLGSDYKYEHELSSSILVNGREASLDLSGLGTMLLAGRAYVNLLDPSAALSGDHSTYMTGESISIRGNQEAYLASITDRDCFNLAADGYSTIVKSNPVSYAFYTSSVLGKNVITDKVVPKKVGDNIYFYYASISPIDQTYQFEDFFSIASNKQSIREKADKLGVKQILIDETNTKILSVGAMMKIDNTKTESQRVLMSKHTVENGNSALFGRYVSDLKLRYKAMLSELKDYGSITKTTVPSNVSAAIQTTTKTPIQTYVDSTSFNRVFDLANPLPGEDTANLNVACDTYETSYDFAGAGLLEPEMYAEYNIKDYNAHVILTKKDNYEVSPTVTNGVIVAKGNVTLHNDFTGIIICAGDVIVDSGSEAVTITMKACPKICEYVASNDDALKGCLKGYTSTSSEGDGDASGHVTISDIKFQDFVSFANWEKKAVNEDVDKAAH